jgi:nucleoside-diphosphate kinase
VERTLVLLKPDAVQRGLIGAILSRFEAKGLQIVGLKLRRFPRDLIERHYAAHKARQFYPGLIKFMTSGPVVAVVLQGQDAIDVTRRLMGKTNGRESEPGTIRGDLCMSRSTNLVHGSDGPESAREELALWFGDASEIAEWTPTNLPWMYSVEEELA